MLTFQRKVRSVVGNEAGEFPSSRAGEVLPQVGAAVDDLRDTLTSLGLNEASANITAAYPIVVGKIGKVVLAPHFGAVVKLLHDEALALSQGPESGAHELQSELVRQCRQYPEGNDHCSSRFVVTPVGDDHAVRRSRHAGTSKPRLTRKEPNWTRAMSHVVEAAEREFVGSAV